MFRNTLAAAAGALALLAAPAMAQEDLDQKIEEDYSYLHDLYTWFHQNPELSFHEQQTAARLAEEMRALGFEVTEGVGGHGVVSVMENGEGPTVMLRADMDALPVKEQTGLPYASSKTVVDDKGNEVPVMHACGHDIHMTAFVGAARRLVEMRDSWSGTLVMINQPAEERGAGAKAMLDDGLFERFPTPDYNIAFHDSASLPAGVIGYAKGWALANVDSVDITIHGIGGHGAYPHTTKDPVVLSAQIINDLQTLVSRVVSPLEPAVVTVGSIHGGTKHNIIPDRVDLQLTVRSYTDEVRQQLLEGIERIAVNSGRVAGLPEDKLPEVEIQLEEYTPATYNDEALAERVIGSFREAGVSDVIMETPPVMGGEDFSLYGRTEENIPSFMFWVGAVDPETYRQAQESGESLPSLHSPFFAPKPRPTIETGVRAMTIAALELLGKK